MFNPDALFKERFNEYLKTMSRYLRYILNGHTTIALVFLISVLAVYYQQWLSNLPENFPAVYILGVIFGLVVTWTPIQTFLKEPDLVFLTVAEDKLKPYFKRAGIYSYFIQLYVVLFVAAGLGPMYTNAFQEKSLQSYLVILIILLVLKLVNLLIHWKMLKIRNKNIRMFDTVIRILLNSGIFVSIMLENYILLATSIILLCVIIINNYYLTKKQSGLAWDVLVEKDRNRMQLFYRMASMFVDVPHLKTKIKKRRILTSILNKRTSFESKNSFDYLYKLTFIRSNDYISMYVRLIVLGGVIIFFLPNEWLKIMMGLLFIYMSNFQLITLYHHHRTNMWVDLYPLNKTNRKKVFLKFIKQLGIIQAVIFSIIMLILKDFTGSLIMFVTGIGFTLLFNHFFIREKINK